MSRLREEITNTRINDEGENKTKKKKKIEIENKACASMRTYWLAERKKQE